MVDNDMPGALTLRPPGVDSTPPRGTVGIIYKGEYYSLVHTKYENAGPNGFEEDDFFMFFQL